MSKASMVIILGEDTAHLGIAARYMRDRGFSHRQIRKEPPSAGSGAGDKFVLDRYAQQVRDFRRRNANASTMLIVLLDGDSEGLTARTKQLSMILQDNKQVARSDGEPIVHLVPCRNVETWRCAAMCDVVDEDTDYKKGHRQNWSGDDFTLVASLLRGSEERWNSDEKKLPSILAARTELERIPS